MKNAKLLAGVVAGIAFGLLNIAQAQAPSGNPGAPSNADPAGWGNSAGNGAPPVQEQMKRLADYLDTVKALNRKDLKDVPTKDVVIQRAKEIIDILKLSCALKDAEIVGSTADKSSGKTFVTNLYEVSCSDNMGYFLTARVRYKKDTGKFDAASADNSTAQTCFSAEGVRAADVAKGEKSELYCQMADNGSGDIKIMAARVLADIGSKCNVTQFRWFGRNDAAKTEYTESACDDGNGYLLQTALPGTTAAPRALNCVDAAHKGLYCELTKVAKPPTLETFKDYLATTDIKCKIENYDQIKVLGQQSISQRYVVEFKCPQQPNGLIGLIPLAGNDIKFESFDCAAAAKRGLACKLNAKK